MDPCGLISNKDDDDDDDIIFINTTLLFVCRHSWHKTRFVISSRWLD